MTIGMGDPVTPATAPPLGVGPLAAQPTPVGIAAALEVGALDVEGTRAKNLAIFKALPGVLKPIQAFGFFNVLKRDGQQVDLSLQCTDFFSYLLPLSARVPGQYNTTILWF